MGSGTAGERSGDQALPAPLRRPTAIMATLAAIVSAILGTSYLGQSSPADLDTWIWSRVDNTSSIARTWALLIDLLGEPPVAAIMVALLALACALLRRPQLAVVALLGPALTGVTTSGLKPVIGRTIHDGNLAYPSGHTAAATALAFVLALLVTDLLQQRPLTTIFMIMGFATTAGAMMGWAQVVLDAHYPTDTIGGFCVALAIVYSTARLVDAVRELTSQEVS